MEQKKYLCLFGIGTLLNDCYNQLVLMLGKEPDFFCDNAKEKWGAKFFEKKCVSPAELCKLGQETIVVITIRNYEEILAQINAMRIEDTYVACFDRGYNLVNNITDFQEKIPPQPQPDLLSTIRGKWTLITGASRGIGRLITLEMARLGANIIAHGRSVSLLEETLQEVSSFNVQAIPIAAELSKPDELEKMFFTLQNSVPRVDIIFNNAGISPPCPPQGFWHIQNRDYLDSFAVNTLAPIRICHQLIPPMLERGYGRIINISSSIQKRPAEMAYACSKAALDKFVFDLAPSLNNSGVAISLADPGWIRTDMGGANAPHTVDSVIPGILLGALLNNNCNGRWISSQDYTGLTLNVALQKAAQQLSTA